MKRRLTKNKKCKNKECDKRFDQKQFGQVVCDTKCAVAYAEQRRKAKQDEEFKKFKSKIKESHKNKSYYIQALQKVFNSFIRERDKDKPCISCDAEAGKYKLTAGHFYPTTYGVLRFNEDNVHGQCWYYCNKNKHGNINEYRIRLIDRIGVERVSYLDDIRHQRMELSIEQLKDMIAYYKNKLKQMKDDEKRSDTN